MYKVQLRGRMDREERARLAEATKRNIARVLHNGLIPGNPQTQLEAIVKEASSLASTSPAELADIAEAKIDHLRAAWFFVGRLISSGLIVLPDLGDPKSLEYLAGFVHEIAFCLDCDT
jgi:hypothetical protein